MHDDIKQLEREIKRREKQWGEYVFLPIVLGGFSALGWLIALGVLVESLGTIGRGAFTSTTICCAVLFGGIALHARKTRHMKSELRDLRMVMRYDRENR